MSDTGRYTVLLYHGVHADDLDTGLCNSSGKHLPRSRFAREMRWLKENRPLVSMHDIARAHRGEGNVPDGAVAINFDDGFVNVYKEARPVLEECGVPATIYLATGFIGTGRMVWSDRLEASILGASRREIKVPYAAGQRLWPLNTDAERVTAFTQIKTSCKSLSEAEKEVVVGAVEEEVCFQANPVHPLYAFMDWDQVREMNASPLFDFGAHTVDHVALTRVPEHEMRRQVDESVARVAFELGQPCTLFSYPEGQAGDYDETVIEYLRGLGFDHCPNAIDGDNCVATTDTFHIRRTMVGFEDRPFPFDRYN